jgi:hypothetical protein
LTPTPGCVWLTSAHLCHQSSNKSERTIIPLKSIEAITKETTLLLIGNSIKIAQSDNINVWLVVFKRDQVFEVLERVWQQSLTRWQSRIDPGANPTVQASSNKGQLDLEKMRTKFKKFFRVPDDPVASFLGSYYRGGRQFVVGEIGVSENFICFKSKFGVSGTKISVRNEPKMRNFIFCSILTVPYSSLSLLKM